MDVSTAFAQPIGLFLTPRANEVRNSFYTGLSADGRVAGGNTNVQGISESSTVFSVFSPPLNVEYRVDPFSAAPLFAADMSDAGDVIVGYARFSDRPFNPEPAMVSAAYGLEYLRTPPGYELGEALGVSGDGNVVVGFGERGQGGAEVQEAFRWTRARNYEMLGRPRPESIHSQAHAANRDGSIIVGDAFTAFGTYDAVVWTGPNQMRLLPGLPTAFSDVVQAFGVSGSGDFIVGRATSASGRVHPVLWGPGGVLDLGVAGQYDSGWAQDVSEDGRYAAVTVYFGSGSGREAAVWTEACGTMLLREYLREYGIAVPSGVTLVGSEAISADGRTIVGNARYFDSELGRLVNVGFVATVPTPAALVPAGVAALVGMARRSRGLRL